MDAVTYGALLPDGSEQAVVTITCLGGGGARALVYTADPSAPGGARRTARVEPDPTARNLLVVLGITAWDLDTVRVEGAHRGVGLDRLRERRALRGTGARGSR